MNWKDLRYFEDDYIISDKGDVIRKSKPGVLYRQKSKIMTKSYQKKGGYVRVSLSKNNKTKHYLLHRLVYSTFGYEYDESKVVMHIDDDPTNNSISNLKIGTQYDNIKDCISKKRNAFGSKNHNSKLTTEEVVELRQLNEMYGLKPFIIARQYGVSGNVIKQILLGNYWKIS